MASVATHMSAFLFLFPAGLRRLLFSSSLYLKNPSLYSSKPWYFSEPRCKNLDFYTLIVALPIASLSQLFFFFAFSSHHPTFRFSFFQQSATLFLFWLLIILIVAREFTEPLLINEAFVFLFAGISFFVEYSVIGNGITGLGGAVYEWLGALTILCAASCFYLSIRPTAFFAEFLLSLALVFKGTWVLQTGLSLYTDAFAFKGCNKMLVLPDKENADVVCDLDEDRLRGIALMNLLFIGHAIVVLLFGVVLFGLLSTNRNLRCGEAGGPSLAELESQTVLMHAQHELEME